MRLSLLMATTILLAAGCTQTPVPYQVNKTTDHPSNLNPIQFPLGVTQERLGPNQYRITAKLAELGTQERARAMALYHASILTEEKQFEGFVIKQKNGGSWCHSLRNNKTKSVTDVDGGVSARITIELMNSQNAGSEKFLKAENVKLTSKKTMDKVLSEQELAFVKEEREEHCEANARKRTNRLRTAL
ncbi:hypothetical protein [Echinimonas agarilytica]|uniref:Lipoprotein n=1 Tax=Echinimonas agarilytica TaxID=1215918 RepID=A0AA41W4D2_9GAMM|nr:hypothetical protein [Echinimonas agarilytica]MCM2678709.1 hypothetical protein [Echinimonas agarilytica]